MARRKRRRVNPESCFRLVTKRTTNYVNSNTWGPNFIDVSGARPANLAQDVTGAPTTPPAVEHLSLAAFDEEDHAGIVFVQ
jgi:hypothetical protein